MLPKKVGSFTLMRRLDADGITESIVGILDDPPGRQVVARRIAPSIAGDAARMERVRRRVAELRTVHQPCLAGVLDLVQADGEPFVLEEWTDGITLRALIDACRTRDLTLPPNVYLHIATQLCNALEALHAARAPGSASGPMLHLGLSPSTIVVGADGRVTLARYGLVEAPLTGWSEGDLRVAYLAPEQTYPEPTLEPTADIFAAGAVLVELSTLEPLFAGVSPAQTVEQIRRSEVTLHDVRERIPGLDKVLLRALSAHPRHRYQRAFVVREDLRGLMAGYSFSEIDDLVHTFLAPLVRGRPDRGADEIVPAPAAPVVSTMALLGQPGSSEDTDTQLDPGPGRDPRKSVPENLVETPVIEGTPRAPYGRNGTGWVDHEAPTQLDAGTAKAGPTLVPEPLAPLPVRSLPDPHRAPRRPSGPPSVAPIEPVVVPEPTPPLTAIATAAVVMTFLACAALVTTWAFLWRAT
jgi:serine/threonine-protein kinase